MKAYPMNAADVVGRSRRSLGLPDSEKDVDVELVGALLRKAAGIYCPCSRATLRAAAVDSLHYCDNNQEQLEELVEFSIDGLLAVGDLLELSDVTVGELPVAGTWVFGAPPAFVVRPSGALFLLGVVADQESLLPPSLNERVVYNGVAREILQHEEEDLVTTLTELGFMEMSQTVWLKSPRSVDADALVARIRNDLDVQPRGPQVPDLKVLDPSRPVNFYRGRWVDAKARIGVFVARRPQEYGAPIWCLVEIFEDGTSKILDLPPRKWRWRSCDSAWHIQLAIDSVRGAPQRYSKIEDGDTVELTFYSPIPQWAERRLMIVGQYKDSSPGLFTYKLPKRESSTEERFLQDQLYLTLIAA